MTINLSPQEASIFNAAWTLIEKMGALFSREPFAESAWEILSLGVEGKILLNISTLSIVNAVYIAKKYDVSTKDVKDKSYHHPTFKSVS